MVQTEPIEDEELKRQLREQIEKYGVKLFRFHGGDVSTGSNFNSFVKAMG